MNSPTTTGQADAKRLEIQRRIEGHLDELPVLPMALAKLMALDSGDDAYFEKLLEVVEVEPNFAVRLLVAANSAASSPVEPVATLQAAITRIGSRRATDLVLALSVARVFIPRDSWERALWRHSIQVAHAARALAAHSTDGEFDGGEAYVSGLLHDIGRFVMFQEAPEQLRSIDESGWDTPEELEKRELRICGLTHTELGAIACSKLGLPEIVGTVAGHHHDRDPTESLSGAGAQYCKLIALADVAMFASTIPGSLSLDQLHSDDSIEVFLRPRMPESIECSGRELRQLIAAAYTQSEAACEALGI